MVFLFLDESLFRHWLFSKHLCRYMQCQVSVVCEGWYQCVECIGWAHQSACFQSTPSVVSDTDTWDIWEQPGTPMWFQSTEHSCSTKSEPEKRRQSQWDREMEEQWMFAKLKVRGRTFTGDKTSVHSHQDREGMGSVSIKEIVCYSLRFERAWCKLIPNGTWQK